MRADICLASSPACHQVGMHMQKDARTAPAEKLAQETATGVEAAAPPTAQETIGEDAVAPEIAEQTAGDEEVAVPPAEKRESSKESAESSKDSAEEATGEDF